MNATGTRVWVEAALFLILGFVAIGIPLIPMGLAADSLPFPDLLLVLIIAWIIRRPETAPLLAVVFLAVLADAMLMRPIGLWSLIILIGTETLRFSIRAFRDIPFVLEWAYVAGLLILMTLLQSVFLLISFSDIYGFSDQAWHVLRTIAIYPIMVAVLHYIFRIRVPKLADRPNRLGKVS